MRVAVCGGVCAGIGGDGGEEGLWWLVEAEDGGGRRP